MKKGELKAKLALLGNISQENYNKAICGLVGCSKITIFALNKTYCARCKKETNIALREGVLIGHKNCKSCKQNLERLTFVDTVNVKLKDKYLETI